MSKTQTQFKLEDFKPRQEVKVLADLARYSPTYEHFRLGQVGKIIEIDNYRPSIKVEFETEQGGCFTEWYLAEEIASV
jgi:hypothetical protein